MTGEYSFVRRQGDSVAGLSKLGYGYRSKAEAQTTTQAWPDAILGVRLGGKWSTSVEAIGRIPRSKTVAAQVEAQLRVYRKLSRDIKAGRGYAHVISYNNAMRPVVEHQIVQELIFSGLELTIRNRLEERFVTSGSQSLMALA